MVMSWIWLLTAFIPFLWMVMIPTIKEKQKPFDFLSMFQMAFYFLMMGPFSLFFLAWCLDEKQITFKRIIVSSAIVLFIGGLITEKTKVYTCTICNDGSISHSVGRGTCSWHRGIDHYEYRYWWE